MPLDLVLYLDFAMSITGVSTVPSTLKTVGSFLIDTVRVAALCTSLRDINAKVLIALEDLVHHDGDARIVLGPITIVKLPFCVFWLDIEDTHEILFDIVK